MLKYLNLEHSVQNISFLNIYEKVLYLMKYHAKFNLFLKFKDEMLQSWYSLSLLIFLQSLQLYQKQQLLVRKSRWVVRKLRGQNLKVVWA
jgi:hypothetical protein